MNNEEKILELLEQMDKRPNEVRARQTETERIEALETDVAILKLAIQALAEEIDELKKAQ